MHKIVCPTVISGVICWISRFSFSEKLQNHDYVSFCSWTLLTFILCRCSNCNAGLLVALCETHGSITNDCSTTDALRPSERNDSQQKNGFPTFFNGFSRQCTIQKKRIWSSQFLLKDMRKIWRYSFNQAKQPEKSYPHRNGNVWWFFGTPIFYFSHPALSWIHIYPLFGNLLQRLLGNRMILTFQKNLSKAHSIEICFVIVPWPQYF